MAVFLFTDCVVPYP